VRRVEIIANRSVQDDIIETLESTIENFFYTVVPVVHGRGRQKRRLGTATWPEENFMLIAYVEEVDAQVLTRSVAIIKERFPDEGIKVFSVS